METPPSDVDELRRLLAERDEEIRQLRLTLDVLSPIDPNTGMLNRNGVIDAIQDGLNWLMRRNDSFAVIAVEVPGLAELHATAADDHRRLHHHLEAVLTAALRRVDKVGTLDHRTYAAVLRDFKAEGSRVVITRLRDTLQAEAPEWDEDGTGPVFTLAVVKPGPQDHAGHLLSQVESLLGKATAADPLIIEM